MEAKSSSLSSTSSIRRRRTSRPAIAELDLLGTVLAGGSHPPYKRLVYGLKIAQSVRGPASCQLLASSFEIFRVADAGATR